MTDREPVNIMGVIAFPNPDHDKRMIRFIDSEYHRQSGSQRKRLYETIQRRQLRPPNAGGAGEMKGGLP